MKYFPQDTALLKHIDHYWIMQNASEVFGGLTNLYGYPGITPELLLIQDGHFSYHYEGRKETVFDNKLFSFIHEGVILDLSQLKAFVMVQFKPRALASLLPFVKKKSGELMSWPVCEGVEVFGKKLLSINAHLKNVSTNEMVATLDDFFMTKFEGSREGFISEMAQELKGKTSLKEIMKITKYSYSTLERYFKKDTGLSPKKFQSLQRYKLAVEEIYDTRNEDWIHYVNKYNYFDQSHFIKEIKRFTTFTPAQLLATPGLRSFRPENL